MTSSQRKPGSSLSLCNYTYLLLYGELLSSAPKSQRNQAEGDSELISNIQGHLKCTGIPRNLHWNGRGRMTTEALKSFIDSVSYLPI